MICISYTANYYVLTEQGLLMELQRKTIVVREIDIFPHACVMSHIARPQQFYAILVKIHQIDFVWKNFL